MNDALRIRRAGGRGILLRASDACITASALFWTWVFWNLTSPTWPVTAAEIFPLILSVFLTFTLAGCMALVVPALWSAVLPGTAAGMLLQEAQRRTLGFVAMLGAASFLAYLSYWIVVGYWGARPAVAESGLEVPLTVATLIFFILVPALAWSWASPAMWLAEVTQAHEVQKIRIAHTSELAMMTTYYARVIALLKSGYDNLTTQQRTMIANDVRGLNLWLNEQMHTVANYVGELTGVESNLLWRNDDGFMANSLNQIYEGLVDDFTYVPPAPRASLLYAPPPPPASAHEIPLPVAAAGSPPREAPREPARDVLQEPAQPAESSGSYLAAREALGGTVWKRDQLERVLDIKPTKALELINVWEKQGYLIRIDNPKYHYKLLLEPKGADR